MKGVLIMKKNKTMRAAGGLLVATLLSTSVVSGTFAKYVTSDKATDTARVAKFGVEVKSTGGLFAKTYKTKTSSGGNTPGSSTDSNSATSMALSVVSSDTKNVVAPGTKSEDTGLTFEVTGTPEVAVKVSFSIDETTLSDVWLGTGTYPNLTTSDVYDGTYNATKDVFTIEAGASGTDNAYYPIKYTLTQTQKSSTGGDPTVTTTRGNLKAIITKLKAIEAKTYAPGTDLSTEVGSFKLTWEWAYGDESSDTGNDTKDTFLGYAAASADTISTTVTDVNTAISAYNTSNSASVSTLTTPTAATTGTTAEASKYNLNAAFNITISVTQVD
jgi:hypothetical protein